jgi:hypothetical protein
MSFISVAILGSGALGAGASLFGGLTQANAEENAANTLSSTTQSGIQQLLSLLGQGTSAIGQYTQTGATDLTSLINQAVTGAGNTLGPIAGLASTAGSTLSNLLNPSTAASTLTQLPGYQFSLNSGLWGVNNAATTSGLGGNVLTAANNYAQGTAQGTWGSLVSGLQNLFGTSTGAAQSLASTQAGALSSGGLSLASLFGGSGQSIGSLLSGGGNSISSLLSGLGQNVAQTQVGAANATAGAATGVASSLGGGINTLTNYALLKNLLSGTQPGMFGGSIGGGATGVPGVSLGGP